MPDPTLLSRPGRTPVVIGIDPGSRRVAIAVVDGTDRPPHAVSTPAGDLADLRTGFIQLLAGLARPDCVFIEQPFAHGHRVPAISYEVIGVLKEVVLSVCELRANDITPSEWKKRSVGDGKASKADTLRFAQEHGYGGGCIRCEQGKCDGLGVAHDEADATCIALAGWNLVGAELMAA